MCPIDAKSDSEDGELVLAPVPPRLEQVETILNDIYAITGEVTRVSGEQDLNYRVVPASGDGDLMLKLVNPAEAEEVTAFQTQLLSWLGLDSALATLAVPVVIHTRAGHLQGLAQYGDLAGARTRLTTWLPGVSGSGSSVVWPHRAVGAALAHLHEALARYPFPVPPMHVAFDLRSAPEILPLLSELRDWRYRTQVAAVLTDFVETDLPVLNSLECQLIHHDFNQDNVMASPDGTQIWGTFDFGDAIVAPRVMDVAVSAAYFFDVSTANSAADSLHGLVAGYLGIGHLSQTELALVPRLMRARYAIALALTHIRAARSAGDQDYTAYLLRNADRHQRRLETLSDAYIADVTQALGTSARNQNPL